MSVLLRTEHLTKRYGDFVPLNNLNLQIGEGEVWPRIARSTASTAILPAKAGACAFHVEISPLRDWRVAVVVWSACATAW